MNKFIVIKEGEGAGGIFYCEITAKVSKNAIATTWGEVQNVLDQVGRPGIAVYILERIDGIVQDSSILESKIENRLLDAGFDSVILLDGHMAGWRESGHPLETAEAGG